MTLPPMEKIKVISSSHDVGLHFYEVVKNAEGIFTKGKKEILEQDKITLDPDLSGDFVVFSPEYSLIPNSQRTFSCVWTDWNLNVPLVFENARKFKLVIIDEAGFEKLKNLKLPFKVYPLPVFAIHASWRVPKPKFKKNKKIDVVFLGNLNPGIHSRRNSALRKILLLPEKYKIAVGVGLYEGETYSEVLSSSKIVFNMSVRKEMNMRVFEAVRCNSLLFLEEDNLEAWKYLTKWESAIPYREDNLQELMLKYLEISDEERDKITSRAFSEISHISENYVWQKIFEIDRGVGSEKIQDDISLRLATFKTLVNTIFNFPTNERFVSRAEEIGLNFLDELKCLVGEKSKIFRASVLNEISFMYLFLLRREMRGNERRGDEEELYKKSSRYILSALSFEPNSAVLWYNLSFLNYSFGMRDDFLNSALRFLKILDKEGENAIYISGFPDVFSFTAFSHYTYLKSYADYLWLSFIEDVGELKRGLAKVLQTQIFIFLANDAIAFGDLRSAEKFCSFAITNFPGCPDFYFLMGKIKLMQRNFFESASAYLKGYELDPVNYSKWAEILLSLLLSQQKQKFHEVLGEIKTIAKRLYVQNGAKIEISGIDEDIYIKPVSKIFDDFPLFQD